MIDVLLLVVLLVVIRSINAKNTFNFEISAHAQTALDDYLEFVGSSLLPIQRSMYRKIQSPLVDIVHFGVVELFPTIDFFSNSTGLQNIYCSLDSDGSHVSYSYSSSTRSFLFKLTDSKGYYRPVSSPRRMYYFSIDDYGSPVNLFGSTSGIRNISYDPRLRPWYIPVKEKQVPLWSPPYIDVNSKQPTLTIVHPLFNKTSDKRGDHKFLGTIAADVVLGDINTFLVHQYSGTSRIVYIVDRDSGHMMGNSLGLPNYMTENGELVMTQPFSYVSTFIIDINIYY